MFEPVRGGTRGGQAEFKWSDVSADKDREVSVFLVRSRNNVVIIRSGIELSRTQYQRTYRAMAKEQRCPLVFSRSKPR